MSSQFISYGPSKLHYRRYGSGPQTIFCFHGYGESADRFGIFEPYLGRDYTLIAIDAPFHGETDWQGALLFRPEEMLGLMRQIMGNSREPVMLFGYSMGGRMALKIFELMPEQVSRLVLVAPDGLHKNKWQWISTQTKLGNRIFQHAMHHPGLLFRLLHMAEGLRIFNKRLSKFAHYYLDDADSRKMLYKIWTTNRRFKPHPGKVKPLIKQYQVPVQLIFGKHDRIIPTKRGHHFGKTMKHLVQVAELEAGHQLLQEKYAKQIASFFVTG